MFSTASNKETYQGRIQKGWSKGEGHSRNTGAIYRCPIRAIVHYNNIITMFLDSSPKPESFREHGAHFWWVSGHKNHLWGSRGHVPLSPAPSCLQ